MNALDIVLLYVFNPSMWSDGLVAVACFFALRWLRNRPRRRGSVTASPARDPAP